MDDYQFRMMLGEVRAIRELLERADEQPAPAKKPDGKRAPSSRWMTIKEVAELFRVSETTIREGVGVFARLRCAPVTEKRVIYVRTDVEKLSRTLEWAAVAIAPDSERLD